LRDSLDGGRRQVAAIDFQLAEPTKAIDYRFFVHADARVTLERVEITSARPATP
jgi:hypothetical protein